MWKKIQNNESVIVTILFNTCSLPIQQVTFQLNWRLYLVFQTILFKLGPLNVKLQYLKKKKIQNRRRYIHVRKKSGMEGIDKMILKKRIYENAQLEMSVGL